MTPYQSIEKNFLDLYGRGAEVFRAPGRVNLIGEHTDYNAGFVMPAAIGFYTWTAIAPRSDRTLRVRSANFHEDHTLDLDRAPQRGAANWSDYPLGVAVTLERAGHRLRGADLFLMGNVPLGAGLSSSASVEVATAVALLAVSGISLHRTEIATLCQRAENEYVGMRCGIMDQFIACHGRAGHALLLDCRSLESRLAPLGAGAKLVVCNTMVKHQLAGSEYNKRREECEVGVQFLRKKMPHVRSLRDVTPTDLNRHGRDMPDVLFRRCRHIVTENVRVQTAAVALEAGDLPSFGRLMAESHLSLRDDYEVSCAELDLMVALADKLEGVYGARMTGGGFGGCTINLVSAANVENFQSSIVQGYEQATGRRPDVYVTTPVDGAGTVNPDEQ